jgi:hypothetical protein
MNYLITPRYSINKRGGKQQPSSKQPPAIIQIKENSVMSTLFTAVSVEQQEIVAGGFDLSFNNTVFSGIRSAQQGASASGFAGSAAGGTQINERVNTAGLNILAADAPAGYAITGLTFVPRT